MDRVDIRILLNSVLSLEAISERIYARQQVSHTNCDDEFKDILQTYNKYDMFDIQKTLSDIISKAEEMKAHLPQ